MSIALHDYRHGRTLSRLSSLARPPTLRTRPSNALYPALTILSPPPPTCLPHLPPTPDRFDRWYATADAGADLIEIYWRQGSDTNSAARASKAPTPWSLKQTITVGPRENTATVTAAVEILSLSFDADKMALHAVVKGEDPNKPYQYKLARDRWVLATN